MILLAVIEGSDQALTLTTGWSLLLSSCANKSGSNMSNSGLPSSLSLDKAVSGQYSMLRYLGPSPPTLASIQAGLSVILLPCGYHQQPFYTQVVKQIIFLVS
jgi:hypothetical protein